MKDFIIQHIVMLSFGFPCAILIIVFLPVIFKAIRANNANKLSNLTIEDLYNYGLPDTKMKAFRQFCIALGIFCILMVFAAYKSIGQAELGFHADYSTKYHAGGGIEAGTWINNNYVGGNTLFYVNGGRKNPVQLSAKYGHDINGFIPFAIVGYYTSGGESVKDCEGIQGFLYGAGISYHFRDSPVKLSIQQTNLTSTITFSLVNFLNK